MRYVLRLKEDRYCEWSDILHAPTTQVFDKRGIYESVLDREDRGVHYDLRSKVQLERNGIAHEMPVSEDRRLTTPPDRRLKSVTAAISGNHAGGRVLTSPLTIDQIIEQYGPGGRWSTQVEGPASKPVEGAKKKVGG